MIGRIVPDPLIVRKSPSIPATVVGPIGKQGRRGPAGPVNESINGKLEIDFSYSDFFFGYKSIGIILANLRIFKVSVNVITPFNEGTLVIGDSSAHGRLMVAADSNLLTVHDFHVEPDYKYSLDTEIKTWFETGNPTTGTGVIIVYYS